MKVYIWGNQARYENYRKALEGIGGFVRFGGEPRECDALLLPGGGDLNPRQYGQENIASRGIELDRDIAEMELLELFISKKRPVLGICRGIQTINVFFGGNLVQDVPGHTAVSGCDRYHRVKTAPSALQKICGENGVVNSAHHQVLDRLGSGLLAIQWTPDGVVEAVCHRTLPVWGVQWHPERLGGAVGDGLLRFFLTAYGEEK